MAWHKILAFGLCAAAAAIGCTVSSDDDPDGNVGGFGNGGSSGDGGTGGTGGTAGTGGGGAAGNATGGAPMTTGGAGGAGGSGGSGGSGGGFQCTPNDPGLSECDACVHAKCCAELTDCNDAVCAGSGTADDPGELVCVILCTDAKYVDAGVVLIEDVEECAATCAADSSGQLATNTDDVLRCINAVGDGGVSNCGEVCLGLF